MEKSNVICKLQVEIGEANWVDLKGFDNYQQAIELCLSLMNAGIRADVTCACGAYEWGGCEACGADHCDWCGISLEGTARIAQSESVYCSQKCADSDHFDTRGDSRVAQGLGA